MVYVDMNGRCGNQMFQYAFARRIMKLNKDNSLAINFYHVSRWRQKTGGDPTYSDQLVNFKVIDYKTIPEKPNGVLNYGSKKQKRLLKRYPLMRKFSYKLKAPSILMHYQNKLHKNGIYKEDECAIKPIVSKAQNSFIYGYFENQKYFDPIRDELIKEFEPIFSRKEKNKKLYDIIDNEESVCISFRVWNEFAYSKEFLENRDVCSKEYYLKAIEKMHELHPNAHFIIFSNDIDWVKKNIEFKYPVSFEDGDDEIWEKLRMMYSCKHFIMSTSTFCWWAQYLCKNKNKTVISPEKWCADGSTNNLLGDDWIRINSK